MNSVRKTFDAELRQLEQQVLKMGLVVEGMLTDAMRSLVEQDPALADEVIRRDDLADDLDLEIESNSMRLLALQQPMSKDLRIIGTAMKIIADLERVGDYSVDIARLARVLSAEPYFKPLEDISRMGRMTCKMLRDALNAFVNRDLELVHQVCIDDNEIDRTWKALLQELMEFMRSKPELVTQATYLILVARYLERIADHVTNVAERVNYMETGVLDQIAATHRQR